MVAVLFCHSSWQCAVVCYTALQVSLFRTSHTICIHYVFKKWSGSHRVCVWQASPYTAGAHTFKFSDPCDYFTYGKAKASTLSLSVLVAIEMFNAMNALSEVCHASMPHLISLNGAQQLLRIKHNVFTVYKPRCVHCMQPYVNFATCYKLSLLTCCFDVSLACAQACKLAWASCSDSHLRMLLAWVDNKKTLVFPLYTCR